MVTKYGIKFKPTDEWVVWYNKDKKKNVIFSDGSNNADDLAEALIDIVYADGGYDGDDLDFEVEAIVTRDDYDESELLKKFPDVTFISDDLIKADITK